jgi:hypothetical protein
MFFLVLYLPHVSIPGGEDISEALRLLSLMNHENKC